MIKAVIFDMGNVVHRYDERPFKNALCAWAGVSQKELANVLPGLFTMWEVGALHDEGEFLQKLITSLGRPPIALPENSLVLAGCHTERRDERIRRLVGRLKQNG